MTERNAPTRSEGGRKKRQLLFLGLTAAVFCACGRGSAFDLLLSSSASPAQTALDQALTVYRQIRGQLSNTTDRRFRVEHLTVQTEAQLDQVRELDLTASMTIGHVFYWGQVFFQNILGPERASRIDPCASLRDRGVRFSLNSDTTTTTVEPLRYIQNAVTRVPQLTPPNVLGPDQRISVDEAIRAVTLDAAYQLFMDSKVGSLEPGKYADLVILSDNPRTTIPTKIRTIRVLQTYLGGQRKL